MYICYLCTKCVGFCANSILDTMAYTRRSADGYASMSFVNEVNTVAMLVRENAAAAMELILKNGEVLSEGRQVDHTGLQMALGCSRR